MKCGECGVPMREGLGGPRGGIYYCDGCMIITGGWD